MVYRRLTAPALVAVAAIACAVPAAAQAPAVADAAPTLTWGAELLLSSAYVWRGQIGHVSAGVAVSSR
jgi:hypothetical protein